MILRRARVDDAQQIIILLNQVLAVHNKIRPDIFLSSGSKYTDKQLEEIILNENTPIFVAQDGEAVIAYAFCVINSIKSSTFMRDMKSLYIDDLCVLDGYRKQGIGGKVLDYVLDFARENGVEQITLNVWQGNEPAISFYKDKGFSPLKTTLELKL